MKGRQRTQSQNPRPTTIPSLSPSFPPLHKSSIPSTPIIPHFDASPYSCKAQEMAAGDDSDVEEEVWPELVCGLTMGIMVEPVTLSCGHSFEKSALRRALLGGTSVCPLCRAPVHSSVDSLSINIALRSIIGRVFPRALRERMSERVEDEEEGAVLSGAAQKRMVAFIPFDGEWLPLDSARKRKMLEEDAHIFETERHVVVSRATMLANIESPPDDGEEDAEWVVGTGEGGDAEDVPGVGTEIHLQLFEPRYIVLARRLEESGGSRFAIQPSPDSDIGVFVHVRRMQFLDVGRVALEGVVESRYAVVEGGLRREAGTGGLCEVEGVAFEDSEGSRVAAESQRLARLLQKCAVVTVASASVHAKLAVAQDVGRPPADVGGVAFWWLRVAPLPPSLRRRAIRTTNALHRLRVLAWWMLAQADPDAIPATDPQREAAARLHAQAAALRAWTDRAHALMPPDALSAMDTLLDAIPPQLAIRAHAAPTFPTLASISATLAKHKLALLPHILIILAALFLALWQAGRIPGLKPFQPKSYL